MYIFGGIFALILFLCFIVYLTYLPEEKARKKAMEEARKEESAKNLNNQQKENNSHKIDNSNFVNSESNKYKEEIEKLKKDLEKKDEIIDQLRRKLFDYEHAKKTKERLDSNKTDALIDRNHELSQENKELDAENFSLELQLADKEMIIEKLLKDQQDSTIFGYSASDITSLFERLHDFENQESRLDHAAISSARRDTWKDLKGKPYKTLTPEQQSQIHFPVLDPSYVYFLPSHPTFHSVYWCYSLDNSPSPNKTTLCDAIQQKLKPCSKCVDPETYNDYLIQHKQPK